MQSATLPAPASKKMLWAGRVISTLVALFMLFDSSVKLLRTPGAVQGSAQLGYSPSVIFPIGLALLGCVVLYALPRTSVLGAILLTGYLGGATATMVRAQSPWFLFPVVIGVLVWAGVYGRNAGVCALIPMTRK
ncbi:MAG TPA: DoxX family protein [Terriglobales bacterium]|nr:DoxX family protein [Terriglobales bacterium]